jgi:hypothetical protein
LVDCLLSRKPCLQNDNTRRGRIRRVSFWGPILGRRWGSAVFVIAGEEVGFDEILFAG